MHFSQLLLVGAFAGVGLASPAPNPAGDITVTPAPAQTSAIAAALQGLEENIGLFDDNEIQSVTQAIATAPPQLQSAIEAALPQHATQNYAAFQSAVNNIITGSPPGIGSLPTGVREFIQSVASQEASIFNAGGAAPTGSNGHRGRDLQAGAIGCGLAVGLIGTLLL